MNTFYYLDGIEIKEIKTVKDFEFIKTKVNKKAVEKISNIPVPDGYKLKNKNFEVTPQKQKEIDDNKKADELEQKIQAELRLIAIASLTAKGEL